MQDQIVEKQPAGAGEPELGSTEGKGPPAGFKIQTLDALTSGDGMVCGPEGCVVPERAADALAPDTNAEPETKSR